MGQKPKKTKSKGRFRWLFWAFGLVMVLFLFVFLLSSPDQFRSMDEPNHYFADLIENEKAPGSVASAANQSDLVKVPLVLTTQTLEVIADNLVTPPFEITDLSNDQLETYQKFQEEMKELYKECLALPVKTKDLSFLEAFGRIGKLISKLNVIRNSYKYSSFPGQIQKYHIRKWNDVYNTMLLGYFVEHEDWKGAAGLYVKMDDWDKEVYYWRKAGFSGRSILAIRSIQRLLGVKKTKDK